MPKHLWQAPHGLTLKKHLILRCTRPRQLLSVRLPVPQLLLSSMTPTLLPCFPAVPRRATYLLLLHLQLHREMAYVRAQLPPPSWSITPFLWLSVPPVTSPTASAILAPPPLSVGDILYYLGPSLILYLFLVPMIRARPRRASNVYVIDGWYISLRRVVTCPNLY